METDGMRPQAVRPLGENDLVFCDFDGTISVIDTGIAVIDALNLEKAWDLEHVWRRGEIDSMQCLAGQWAMVDLPPEELYALLDSFPLHEDFRDFVSFLEERRAHIVVVSDGLDLYLDRMLARLGLTACDGERVLDRQYDCIPRFVNHGTIDEGGVTVSFPYRTPVCAQCGNCKLHHLFELRPHFSRILYVGDGHSDMCPAKYADVLFARSHLAEDAARRGMPYFPFESFDDIMQVLR
jgi:2-hydroxy-3-keto-5-methylthiopentenyl-1-phosphate phosphatase